MDESQRSRLISDGLYTIVSARVGPERLIQIRRSVTNLNNDMMLHFGPVLMKEQMYGHLSGSYAEGFRFRTSDRDYMFIYTDIKVVADSRLLDNYDNRNTIILMETDHTRPGFALLRLLSKTNNSVVTGSCVKYSQGLYVSSLMWKEVTPKNIPNSSQHGPCESGWSGEHELDYAYCLECDTWPALANACIVRLARVGWPSFEIIRTILKDGCHLVAIGGRGSQTENIEWRLSFSFAEKTLIHHMNHCQFLCYGLLKILLKEVIEKGEQDKLLCSYFLKTAVLWEICENTTISWTSSNYSNCFWACFKRLIHWVVNEYCPNFFIPENNMFYGKVQGRARLGLLDRLIGLYNEGVNCLLRCPTLQPELGMILERPSVVLIADETCLKSYDCHIIEVILREIIPSLIARKTVIYSMVSWMTEQMSNCDNEIRKIALYIWKRYALQYLVAFSMLNDVRDPITTNKRISYHRRSVLRALRKLSFDHLHHRLLSSVFMYRHGHYRDAVKALRHSKLKLQQPNMMYEWNLDVEKYRAAGGEHTHVITMMRRTVTTWLILPMFFCVPELTMEHQASNFHDYLISFPPLAMANFLLYLCHHHLSQPAEADAVLQELAMLVRYDKGYQIYHTERAISWTMLGICQEMSGDLASAYQSCAEALNNQFNDFKEATKERIHQVTERLFTS